MFTGIVEEVGRVLHLDRPSGDLGVGQLSIQAEKIMSDLRLGDSVSVNGACLTVVKLDDDRFSMDLALETLRRTDLGSLSIDDGVNLERSLAVSDRLGGHIVQGHVDARGRYTSAKPEGASVIMSFRAPKRLMPYIVEKGFVAVDGISLTVTKKRVSTFTIAVIPYTLENTVLKERSIGDFVNLEVDILAKYVESLFRS